MSEIYHSNEDSVREGLMSFLTEIHGQVYLTNEVLLKIKEQNDRKKTKEKLAKLRDELNTLNGTQANGSH